MTVEIGRDLSALTPIEQQCALDRAVNGLRDDDPLRSASISVIGWQRAVMWSLLATVAVFGIWKPMQTAIVLIGLCTIAYVFTMVDRVLIFRQGLAARAITIPESEARAIPDSDLPPYTILVPAYNEPEVVGDLLAAMARLEYPADKLQILLLLEADLGLRICARGYRTAVLDSTTLEEANSDPINWIRQRSRWYKGYLQTWLVHIRRPRQLLATIGLRPFIRFNLVMAGTPIIAVLNMLFWFITLLWFLGQPALVGAVFPRYIYFPALVALIVGNGATLYMNLIALREDDRGDLLVPALTVPIFFVMMSIAAAKGLYQLIRNPSYWEKTFHGLAHPPEDELG